MSNTISVIKVGGNELDDLAFLNRLCSMLGERAYQTVLVHGGGKEISAALELYGQPVRFIEGIRVTPPESMAIMEMVVCGRINKRIVAHLVNMGQHALGLSGVDLGIVRCEPYRPGGADLGRVGTVSAVNVAVLLSLLSHGWLPVLAPVALGQHDGLTYNINADHAALGIAAALASRQHDTGPTELVFVSNVPGVLVDGQVRGHLAADETETLIEVGAISGGMIPKVRSALLALSGGVTSVRITNLDGLLEGGTRIGKSL